MVKGFFYGFIFFFLITGSALAKELTTSLSHLLLIDKNTGTILYDKEAKAPFAPGALVKLMTAKVIFDAIKAKKLSLDKTFYVSDYAWKTGGAPSKTTTMFAAYHSYVSVNNLLLGLVVDNANDAALVLAEGYAGSEEKFVALMNEEAHKLHLSQTHFVNATGLPQEGQTMSLKDAMSLLLMIAKEHPDFYKYYQEESFDWNKIKQRNKNPLMGLEDYQVEAGISGYNETDGYSFVGIILKEDKILLLALNGVKDKRKIRLTAEQILKWAVENFQKQKIFDSNKIIGQANVFGGHKKHVSLVLNRPLSVLLPKKEPPSLKAQIRYKGPLLAPISKGDCVAQLEIYRQKKLLVRQDLYSAETIKKAGFLKQAKAAFYEFSVGWMRRYLYVL